MANNKHRYVNTKFWIDSYVSDLDPSEKLLFIYLITNGHTNISGVYEIPRKIIAIETGFDFTMIGKIMDRLEAKIRYIDGFIVIKNFIKHQETGSGSVSTGIVNCLKELDPEFLKNIVSKGYYVLPKYYIDTLYRQSPDSQSYLYLYSYSYLYEKDKKGNGSNEPEKGDKRVQEVHKAVDNLVIAKTLPLNL